MRRTVRLLLMTAALAVFAAAPASGALSLRIVGNHFVDGKGHSLRLLGVNRSGAEYACIQGWGFWDGPVDTASIAAMRSWGINSVRIPLNEDCWLGINAKPALSGPAYRAQIAGYVRRLHAAGLYAILDLHWNAPGSQPAKGQQQLPDADHAPAFWRSVARTFRVDHAVVLDLYNEPHDVSWECWRAGCGSFAGMQQLVSAVRSTGSTAPLLLGGLAWANDLSGWSAHAPRDPAHQLAAGFHLYNFNACSAPDCWNRAIAPLAARVPVVTGELGESDCASSFIESYMPWADAHRISYVGWTWDVWDCKGGPALISAYDGTPTPFGAGFRAHLLALGGHG